MGKNHNKVFDEITKAKISPYRNAVISRIVRNTGDGEKPEKGYLIAQQMEVVEGGESTKLFIKGGSLKLYAIENVVDLRDALNKVLKEEGYRSGNISDNTCRCSSTDRECKCTSEDEGQVKNKSKHGLTSKNKFGRKAEVHYTEEDVDVRKEKNFGKPDKKLSAIEPMYDGEYYESEDVDQVDYEGIEFGEVSESSEYEYEDDQDPDEEEREEEEEDLKDDEGWEYEEED